MGEAMNEAAARLLRDLDETCPKGAKWTNAIVNKHDLRAVLAERDALRKALGYVSRMRVFPDHAVNITTLSAAVKIARQALTGAPDHE